MPENSNTEIRFNLPVRIRSRQYRKAELGARIDLIDRIADLQGIHVADRDSATVPCRVDVYLNARREGSSRKKQPAMQLCSMGRDGIWVYGLDRWARYQILARGWGGLNEKAALVYLPRDARETEAVWKIVRRAYDNLKTEPGKETGSVVISKWDWPRNSRTSLQ